LPEEWLIERIQQVGANSRNLLSPSFIVICGIFAAIFCNWRYIFVTASRSSRTRQVASPVEPLRWVESCKSLKLADCIIVTTFCRLNKRHSSPILNWDMSFSCFFCVVERTHRIGLVGPCPRRQPPKGSRRLKLSVVVVARRGAGIGLMAWLRSSEYKSLTQSCLDTDNRRANLGSNRNGGSTGTAPGAVSRILTAS
jgi:hypothetical protein